MNSDHLYFTLIYSARVTESLEAAGDRAKAAGRAREVEDRVHRSQDLTEYIGFVGLLIARYNIRHASKHVFVVYPVRVARWAGF